MRATAGTSPPVCIGMLSIVIASLLLRTQIADALVLRGDEFLVRNDLTRARTHYWRALWIDGASSAAVDRTIYVAVLLRNPAELNHAIALASAFLRRFPGDAAIRADRGLCYLLVRRYSLAAEDYSRAAHETRDPQIRMFAQHLNRIAGLDFRR